MNKTLVGKALASTVIGIWAISGIYKFSVDYADYLNQRSKEMRKEYVEKINTILRLNTIPDNYLNPITNRECQILKGAPIFNELIWYWVEEIILQTNTPGMHWNKKKRELVSNNYQSLLYENEEESTFKKRHLAVSYRMKGAHEWQAFTHEQIQRIFLETYYATFFPFKNWACNYNSQIAEWKSVDLVGISHSPSGELTKRLNERQIYPISRRTLWR